VFLRYGCSSRFQSCEGRLIASTALLQGTLNKRIPTRGAARRDPTPGNSEEEEEDERTLLQEEEGDEEEEEQGEEEPKEDSDDEPIAKVGSVLLFTPREPFY